MNVSIPTLTFVSIGSAVCDRLIFPRGFNRDHYGLKVRNKMGIGGKSPGVKSEEGLKAETGDLI